MRWRPAYPIRLPFPLCFLVSEAFTTAATEHHFPLWVLYEECGASGRMDSLVSLGPPSPHTTTVDWSYEEQR